MGLLTMETVHWVQLKGCNNRLINDIDTFVIRLNAVVTSSMSIIVHERSSLSQDGG